MPSSSTIKSYETREPLALNDYTHNDHSLDEAAEGWVNFDMRHIPECDRWIAGHYGCLDSPLALTRLNREEVCVCKQCGSREVEWAMWVDMQTNTPVDDFGSWGEYEPSWCRDCEEHNGLIYKRHYG